MFGNRIKLTFRNLLKHKSYALINIFGLTIGLSTCLLIFLFIDDELSFERFLDNPENIFRLESAYTGSDGSSQWAATQGFLIPTITSKYPEIYKSVKLIAPTTTTVIECENEFYNEEKVAFADSTFFEVFSFELISGNPQTVLDAPNKLVLSENHAKKYFGSADPLGKLIKISKSTYKVAGIMKNMPHNSHMDFDIVVSISEMRRQRPERVDGRGAAAFYSYIRLKNDQAAMALKNKLVKGVYEIYNVTNEQGEVGPPEEWTMELVMQPITDIHLKGHAEKELSANSNIMYVYIFGSVGLFILVIAGFNYMNLATARTFKRTKEVGMRKVLGAGKWQVFFQFISESFLVTAIALILALILTYLLLPFFNAFSGKEISRAIWLNYDLLIFVLISYVTISVLSGFYPSLFLSRFKPINALKSNLKGGKDNLGMLILRRSLVVFQFSISIFLIIGIMVVNQQLEFIQNKDIGFEKEQVVVVNLPGRGSTFNLKALRDQLSSEANIFSAAASSAIPGKRVHMMSVRIPDLAVEDMENANEQQDNGYRVMRIMSGDEELVETLGLEIVEGRSLTNSITTDKSAGFILNESAIREFGLEEDPIGRRFEYLYDLPEPKSGHIVGVVKDFHYASLHTEVEPIMIHVHEPYNTYLNVRISGKEVKSTLAKMEEIWNQFQPSIPFDYFFLDELYDNQYKLENSMGQIISFFTTLAVVIACLGLFGLASFIAEQKTKEVGVRKVLGASISSIMLTLSKEFLILVALSNIVACIPAYFILNNWLNGFAFHINISVLVFLYAGLLSLFIAMSSISLKTYQAAVVNPVKSLKYE